MELFKNIRLKIGKSILARKIASKKRKVFYSDFSQVKKIGIVWDASKHEDFERLSKFYQKMHEKNINVSIISYFPEKALPDKYTAIRYLTCLRKEEIGFFNNPCSAEAINFIKNPFDILIDINFKKILPLQYISSLSDARFKVGLSDPDPDHSPFDLMMDIVKPVDIENYLNQVIHYLEMMNSVKAKTI